MNCLVVGILVRAADKDVADAGIAKAIPPPLYEIAKVDPDNVPRFWIVSLTRFTFSSPPNEHAPAETLPALTFPVTDRDTSAPKLVRLG